MTIDCKEATVKFKDLNKHGERISCFEHPGAMNLQVQIDPLLVTVFYMNEDSVPLKVIMYMRETVHEIMFENSVHVYPFEQHQGVK